MTKGRTSCHNSLDPKLQVLHVETNQIKHNLNVDVLTKLCTVKASRKDEISNIKSMLSIKLYFEVSYVYENGLDYYITHLLDPCSRKKVDMR